MTFLLQATEDDGKVIITADNPISCLFEYAKKVKIPDPDFECVAENLLETWQKGNQTFKKVRLRVALKKITGISFVFLPEKNEFSKASHRGLVFNGHAAPLFPVSR